MYPGLSEQGRDRELARQQLSSNVSNVVYLITLHLGPAGWTQRDILLWSTLQSGFPRTLTALLATSRSLLLKVPFHRCVSAGLACGRFGETS